MAEPDLETDFSDIQGLLRFGHGHLTEASFHLLAITDRKAAQAWLLKAPITTAEKLDTLPDTALQVAFTRQGLEALAVEPAIIRNFSNDFVTGMSGDASRSRRLGDTGLNRPSNWAWGGRNDTVPHLVVMLYARPGGLDSWEQAIRDSEWTTAFAEQARLPTFDIGEIEPFGFVDGLSQPAVDWSRELPLHDKQRTTYTNLISLGEFLLGYPNEYGQYTQRPLLDPMADSRALDLPQAEDRPDRRDLGRNGTYLVFRQLHQDVRGFWQFVDRQAGGDPEQREHLAAAIVGRARDGRPLVPLTHDWIDGVGSTHKEVTANHFTYTNDPDGELCPFGSHIRRTNPRSGDLPYNTGGWYTRLLRTFGFKRESFRDDLIASARFHRLLRRGREYGQPLSPADALQPGSADEARGLHFICLVADPARQFEFVQNAWVQNTGFAGLCDEKDPLLGTREPDSGGQNDNLFTHPHPAGPARRFTQLPQFVTVRGGGYFFMPGLRALRYLAGAPSERPIDIQPEAVTANRWLQAVHRGLVRMLHIERRLEPYFRPLFNRLFREKLARLIQYLLNRRRPMETLSLAEERIAHDEEASLDSIIMSFGDYMRRTYRPGTFERGGNTKTHGIVRAEVTILDDLPDHIRRGVFARPKTYPAYVRYSGPGPNLPNDIEDVGFVSMAVKLMDVPGAKLLDDEKYTQDFLSVCTPTFVTPNTRENAKLQIWSFRDMPVFYFLNPFDSHLLDFFMQSLWNETQYNPLGARYWSCVPYLLGEGQAMMYSFAPRSEVITDIPGIPFGHVPPNYLRDNMIATLARQDVEFDLLLQVQTDPHLMPVEDASIRWPEKISPFVPAARIHIPRQVFNTTAHDAFSKQLSMNPWHCVPEHRPLGNQSRARLRMYSQLSRLRQQSNQTPHIEPTGDEIF